MNVRCRLLPALPLLLWSGAVSAIEFDGLLDLRAAWSDSNESWMDGGLGKQRFADEESGLQLGQAALEARAQLADTLNATLGINAYTDRDSGVDISEAWLQWKPLPVAGLRFKARAGAFFVPLSLENTAPGWTSPWMLSTSAINTWVGEELRTPGLELSLGRPGMLHDSAHDLELLAAVFRGNDPAGGLLTWRGWSIGDRVTGLTERLPLPDLPVYSAAPGWQVPWEEPFHEIDNRNGYYAGINYGYNNRFRLQALHYDNHGDPEGFDGGQWAWDTTFDHLGMRIDLANDWSLLAQYMQGETVMAWRTWGVYANFDAWYLLASKARGKERWTLRYDVFGIDDEDLMPNDDNSEDGTALAFNWQHALTAKDAFGIELQRIAGTRAGRGLLHAGADPGAGDDTVTEYGVQWFYRRRL